MSGHTFTFVVDYDGGTYISQHVGPSLSETTEVFLDYMEQGAWVPMDRRATVEFLELSPPTPLDEVANVWCFTLDTGDEEKSALVNVVLTDIETARSEVE